MNASLPMFSMLLMLVSGVCTAQDPELWQSLTFSQPEDYKKNEPVVLECANFVLTMPAEAGNPARKSAMEALAKWMAGTPDHSFVIDEAVGRLMEKNEAILSIYMAALAQTVLGDAPPSGEDVKYQSIEKLLGYCEDPRNKVPPSKELKKALSARKKGKLKEYLAG